MLQDGALSSNLHSLFFLVSNKRRIVSSVQSCVTSGSTYLCFCGLGDDFVSDDAICGGVVGLDGCWQLWWPISSSISCMRVACLVLM